MKKLTKSEIKDKLELHSKWLKNEAGGEWANLRWADLREADLREADLRGADLQRANLREADLREADLREADLRGADLQRADLRGADLRGADLDFSCFPLWCGTNQVKVDAKIAMQLAAHYCAVECDDPEYLETRKALLEFAKKSHIAQHLSGLQEKGK